MQFSIPIFRTAITAAALVALAPYARAQSDVIPPEVLKIYDDMSDIDKMRVLNPLKLTKDQIGQLITVIKKQQDEYNATLVAAAVTPIKPMAKEMADTRRRVLEGAEIPKDFDDKVKKFQADFLEKRNKAEYDTIKGLSAALKKIFTEKQVATGESLAKKFWTEKAGKDAPKLDYFNAFTLWVFIQYPRIIPLLEDLKKVTTASALPPSPKNAAAHGVRRVANGSGPGAHR